MRASLVCLVIGALAAGGCVPADEAVGLGSVEFTFTVSTRTELGLLADETDGWAVVFDRIVLGFKTMTIGKVGVDDVCSYRGRGESADVVFDPRLGLVQTFNGIEPVACPDVGVIFTPPGASTTLGNGVTSKDLVELASGSPAHAIIEATATEDVHFRASRKPRTLRIALRFDTERTPSRFGGCRDSARGVRIVAGTREEGRVLFAAERLFRNAIAPNAGLRVFPFNDADERSDGDGVVTMDDLDMMPLGSARRRGGEYLLPDDAPHDSFGDFVRFLFRQTLLFGTEDGLCIGNAPGDEDTSVSEE
ncbi:MAG TPA: hypothetical protein VM925_29230 [Labilithrix sp.]|nr:hypothetical protein [Labilithrix sp.]